MTQASGIDFVYRSGHDGETYLMPEIMGGGVALFDADADGDLDVYFVQGGALPHLAGDEGNPHANALWLNDAAARFSDGTNASGTGGRGYGMGVACGDTNGDGAEDLYVTNVGANELFVSHGPGKFEERGTAAGVADPGWGASAGFLDYDRDGHLDLFVTNYLVWSASSELPCFNRMSRPDYCSPKNYEAPAPDVLYRGRGDGTFEDVSVASGVAGTAGTGLGFGAGDFDGDGWTDVFVANDGMADVLWRNGQDGTFEDVAPLWGCAVDEDGLFKAGMGVTVADVDLDGDLDLMVCNLERESDSLYLNEGGWFEDRTARSGLGHASRGYTRFGMAWVDFDHDGLLDLFQANGRVNRHSHLWSEDPYAEPNLVLRGTAPGRFEPLVPMSGTAEPLIASSRAAAFGDLDGDGGVDVVVANRDAPAHVLRNRVADRGHWIRLRVLEVGGRAALGARVELTVGERRIARDVAAAYSYQASNDPRVHVGLGADAQATDVRVTFADGHVERFGDLAGNREHVLRRE